MTTDNGNLDFNRKQKKIKHFLWHKAWQSIIKKLGCTDWLPFAIQTDIVLNYENLLKMQTLCGHLNMHLQIMNFIY